MVVLVMYNLNIYHGSCQLKMDFSINFLGLHLYSVLTAYNLALVTYDLVVLHLPIDGECTGFKKAVTVYVNC